MGRMCTSSRRSRFRRSQRTVAIKSKPATNAQKLAKLMTGVGGLGKYANVMSPKQLPLRLGTLQKARAVGVVGLA